MLAHKKCFTLFMGFCFVLFTIVKGQIIRSYTSIFSQNIHGGTTIFGNTSMQIIDNSVANIQKMNESGNPNNGIGGIGFSQFGNDEENMQPVITDFQIPVLSLINSSENWNYRNSSTDLGIGWQTNIVSSPNWVNSNGSFGYGINHNTSIPHAITNYFHKQVILNTPALYNTVDFSVSYDDGAVIYVNGVEVKRLNMPLGIIDFNTFANNTNFSVWENFSIPSIYFHSGENTIAVEIHQVTANSNTCFFDMKLSATPVYTSNSSSANLELPAGTNSIKFARLYWGGKIPNATLITYPDTLKKIKIRKGTSGPYTNLVSNYNADVIAVNGTTSAYQSYTDVTNFLQNNSVGPYTIAEVPMIEGSASYGGNYAGWCIVIAFENNSLPLNSVRLFDGFSEVYNNGNFGTQIVTISGLNLPNNPLSTEDAKLSVMAWEGDANISSSTTNPQGDYVKINGIAVSNTTNPATNFFNGSISKNGSFVNAKNCDFTNQMGIDIDEINIGTGYGILPNAANLQLEFGTDADKFLLGVFGFTVKMKNPLISINKSVIDANSDGILQNNEELTYNLSGLNAGPGTSYKTMLVDTLPSNVTYVPNSLVIINAPGITNPIIQTDTIGDDFTFVGTNMGKTYIKFFIGTHATFYEGGFLDSGSNYQVKFKVRVNNDVEIVRNKANIFAQTINGESISAESTVSFGSTGGPLTVKLLSFSGMIKSRVPKLFWTTENEVNNDYFDVERSEDGILFYKRGTVKSNGNNTLTQHYQFDDNLCNKSSVIFYRLKIVDLHGKFLYSHIIALQLKEVANDILSVYPNPFINTIKISITVEEDTHAQLRILSFDGKEMIVRRVFFKKGTNIFNANELQYLASGNYILEIYAGLEKYTEKILKK